MGEALITRKGGGGCTFTTVTVIDEESDDLWDADLGTYVFGDVDPSKVYIGTNSQDESSTESYTGFVIIANGVRLYRNTYGVFNVSDGKIVAGGNSRTRGRTLYTVE